MIVNSSSHPFKNHQNFLALRHKKAALSSQIYDSSASSAGFPGENDRVRDAEVGIYNKAG